MAFRKRFKRKSFGGRNRHRKSKQSKTYYASRGGIRL